MPSDQVARAAQVLGPAAAWPAEDGEPVFAEPWEGRAFALAIDVVERSGWSWDEFRQRLTAAIADDPHRPYYESWVVALEHLVVDDEAVSADDLGRARNRASAYRYDEPGLGDVEVFPVDASEDTLRALLAAIVHGPWWVKPRSGPPIQGAADELRRCRHAELYRTWLDGAPASWGFRMFDGDDDQQLDVLLPNPFLDDDGGALAAPDWSRLACWDELRRRFLALGPDPADRLG